jgi:eukaryotic-like serine/threonine-protein kinase
VKEDSRVAATYSSLIGLAVGGKYEIRRVLGAGGMGVVCEAVHLDLGKKVAVKLIDKTMKESELIVARFRREARAAGQINSEHIVDVFDVGADARVGLYMVMELLTGEDLQGRLERDKRLDVKTGVMIAHQIARGLAKAHEAGIIHRDLKPANVFLTERDSGQLLVKLLDFGVSKLLQEAPGSARITGSGTPIGTPLYMAPEQAEGKADVDVRADVWSLGAVLYEAFSGTPPFADKGTYHATILGILTTRPRLLNDVAPWVPQQVASVVDAMLVHDKNARLPNAQMVTQRLLDAFPTVLPDGTGKYTAVIVPHAASSIDATGDTEIFNAASFAAARVRASNAGAPPTDPDARRASTPPPPPEPARTIADGQASESLQTGAATSIEVGRFDPRSLTPVPMSTREVRRTEPLPPSTSLGRSPLSSGSGAPISAQPASLDPGFSHPREDAGAPQPSVHTPEAPPERERRSIGVIALIPIVIVAVAIGGFLVGQRAAPPTSPSAVPATSPSAAPPAPPSARSPVAPPASIADPAASTSASASSSASAPAPSASAPPRPKRKPKPPKPPEGGEDTPASPIN